MCNEVQIIARAVSVGLCPVRSNRAALAAPIGSHALLPVPRDMEARVAIELECVSSQERTTFSECNHALNEAQQVSISPSQIPVHPADLIVLAIRIVITLLRAAHFVAGQNHRHAMREQQDRSEVLALASAQCIDGSIVRGTLGAAVPAPVGVSAVLVV